MFVGNDVTIFVDDDTGAQGSFNRLFLTLAKKIIEKLVKELASRSKKRICVPCGNQSLGADIGHRRSYLFNGYNRGGSAIGGGFTGKYPVK
jgi:hypothetical protein